MRKTILLLLFPLLCYGWKSSAQINTDNERSPHISHYVKIETDKGNIVIGLYDETPHHRDNFLSLVDRGAYDGVLFHRVINHFMIQTGNLQTKSQKVIDASQDTTTTTIKAEFIEGIFHKRGAVAAARTPDDVNPEKASSISQFYIVTGNYYTNWDLQDISKAYGKVFTDKQIETYKTMGGTPHLDGDYTVFGEVCEGMDIVSKIEKVKTDDTNRPIKDIRIKKAYRFYPQKEKK